MRVASVLNVLSVLILGWGSVCTHALADESALTAEQIADIDEQIEKLNITRAQVIAPEENPNIDRRPEGALTAAESDSAVDQGE